MLDLPKGQLSLHSFFRRETNAEAVERSNREAAESENRKRLRDEQPVPHAGQKAAKRAGVRRGDPKPKGLSGKATRRRKILVDQPRFTKKGTAGCQPCLILCKGALACSLGWAVKAAMCSMHASMHGA
jgi:hypothetical protein